MSDYATQITDLLISLDNMVKNADYSDLSNIQHKRIVFSNEMLNNAITKGYCEYHLIDWCDYEQFHDERKRIMQIYRSKLYLGRD